MIPILTTHDRGTMTKMAEDILDGALAQSDPHAKGQPGRVHLLVALAVQELAPSGVLSWFTADSFEADGC